MKESFKYKCELKTELKEHLCNKLIIKKKKKD